MSFRIKALVLGALVVCAMGFLMFRTLGSQGAKYYIEVPEYAAAPKSEVIKLAGYVKTGSIEQAPGSVSLRFAALMATGRRRD